jgi:hypothetical protein
MGIARADETEAPERGGFVKPNATKHRKLSRLASPLAILMILGALLAGVYVAISVISFRFAPGTVATDRPVLVVLGLLGFAFFVYLAAIWAAVRAREGKVLLTVIILGGVLFRGLSLYAWPILEIDIYRYIWDGHVALEGVSPYRYSPAQVLSADADSALPADLGQLVDLRDQTPPLHTILSRVHYNELPTIYPPVSQAVFAATAFLTPNHAGVLEQVVAMKAALVLFDLATLGVVIALLRLTGRHVGWAVAYGWCPLVIKEIANTGHLDSIAVFLTILALYLLARLVAKSKANKPSTALAVGSALVLALAVGAKLYPLVLTPLFAAGWLRCRGMTGTVALGLAFLAATTALLWPMIPPLQESSARVTEPSMAAPSDLPPPVPTDTTKTQSQQPQNPASGLTAFLRRWEMNDFLFLLVVENLKPTTATEPSQRAWFAITPDSWRARMPAFAGNWLPAEPSRGAFLLARAVTLTIFLVILIALVWRVRASSDSAAWLRVGFLVLAWFWLLSPTQNPLVLDLGPAAGDVCTQQGLVGYKRAGHGVLPAFLADLSLAGTAGGRDLLLRRRLFRFRSDLVRVRTLAALSPGRSSLAAGGPITACCHDG